METTLREIARIVGGTIDGNPDTVISGLAGIQDAGSGDITFVANPKYEKFIEGTGAAAIVCAPDIAAPGKNLLKLENPYLAYAKLLRFFNPPPRQPGTIDERAAVGKNVHIGKHVTIYPFVTVGDDCVIEDGTTLFPHCFIGDGVTIGQDTLIHPNVTIREGCVIGKRVIIHPGTVIGSDGFGFAKDGPQYCKIPQIGNVRIDDDVEIGAGNTIDRAAIGTTWIQRGTKTDNLVHIAHNVVVGEDTVLVAQVGISGSTKVGSRVTLAGQVGVVGHITIGDDVMVGAQAGISGSVPPGQIVSGSPHMSHRTWLKASRSYEKLPEMRKTVHALKQKVQELESAIKHIQEDND